MQAGKLREFTIFTRPIVGGTANHCVDQYTFFVSLYCSLKGDTAMPGGLHVWLCQAFLVLLQMHKAYTETGLCQGPQGAYSAPQLDLRAPLCGKGGQGRGREWTGVGRERRRDHSPYRDTANSWIRHRFNFGFRISV